MWHKNILGIIFILLTFFSCDKETTTDTSTPRNHNPIIFVHGFLASGDTYHLQIQRFTSNGYDLSELYTFDWNTLGLGDSEALLNNFIDKVLEETGAEQVDLVGHSAGSGLVYGYCSKKTQADKVGHLVLLAGFPQSKPGGSSGEVPTLNVYSTADAVSAGGGDIPRATNLKLTDKDHYEVATCEATFSAMYKLFNDNTPSTTSILPEEIIKISGKALSFGENLYVRKTKVDVFEVNENDGSRISPTPLATFSIASDGYWGPLMVQKNAHYEFLVTAEASGSRPVHYYFEPFVRSSNAVYLRSYPANGSLGAAFLSSLPQKDEQAVTAFFGASKAAVKDRDQLSVNDINLSTEPLTKASNTTIALFVYDANNNQNSDGGSVGLFASFPFLKATDAYISTNTSEKVTYSFNDRKIHLRNWKSKSEGVSVAVFQ